MIKPILVGGQALRNLGSKRYTEDLDFLIFNEKSQEIFIKDEEANIDYLNAAAFGLFKEIFDIENGNSIASPNSLLELKAYAWVQHLCNGNWAKAADCEFDMAFLVRELKAEMPKLVKKYITSAEWVELSKELNQIKK